MKYYGFKPIEHEAVDSQSACYFKLAIERAEKANERLLTTTKNFQDLLIHIETLVTLAEIYPDIASFLIKKERSNFWQSTFNIWFDKVGKKIPEKFRDDFKNNADGLFEKLLETGH